MPDTDPPEPPAVVVTPIPKSESTTLRLNKLWAIWTPIAATLLTIIDLLMQAFADPALAPLIAKYLPIEARIAVTAVVLLLARQNWNKRMNTAQPIIGSPAEEKVMRVLGIVLVCLLATGCASTPPPKVDKDFWRGARLDQAFHVTATFLDRLFPPRAKPEHGGVCIGVVWTGTGYRCSESSILDAGSRPINNTQQPPKENDDHE